MFAKFTQLHGFGGGRGRRPQAAAAACNNKDSARCTVHHVRRLPRRVLTCRWQETPTGALTCVWGYERVDAPAADEPPTRRLIGRLKRLLALSVVARPPLGLAAI